VVGKIQSSQTTSRKKMSGKNPDGDFSGEFTLGKEENIE
jgi:hypothetical protein